MPDQHTGGQDRVIVVHISIHSPWEVTHLDHDIELATLVGSRICHDLISPIGAINNGLELIGMGNPSAGPEMVLIQDSVCNASARIRFFRMAFGAAGEQVVGRAEIVSVLDDVYNGTRLTVAYGPLDGHQRSLVRLTFLALMCFETAMPYGGRIEIAFSGGRMVLTGHADKFRMEAPLWAMLSEGAAARTPRAPRDLRPSDVQFGLLPLVAADAGISIETQKETDRLILRI